MVQATIAAATLHGVEAIPVEVQADVSAGLPLFGIVGLPDAAVQEARDRVRSALRAAGFNFPNARVIVNLAPAPLRKHGTGFDLPIALAILAATAQVPIPIFERLTAVGELGLDGTVRSVPGMLAHAVAAAAQHLDLLGPIQADGVIEAVPGLRYRAIRCISAIRSGVPQHTPVAECPWTVAPPPSLDLAAIAGHAAAKRCLEIAAAGGHNVMLIGPPGSGKTMLARALAGLLPPLSDAERLESALVHSVAGLDPLPCLSGARPFRAPHHSCSIAGLVGGGMPPRPGEISLAHNGVLFLDELPEFAPAALQALRQPIEDGTVTLVRVAGAVRYPARVTLATAMNPCPCGYAGDPARTCTCPPGAVARYGSRIGGPLYDRMDISIRVDRVDPRAILSAETSGLTTAGARVSVLDARSFGASRPRSSPREDLEPEARAFLESAARSAHLSGRALTRLIRVARTIADLDATDHIGVEHVSEALGYRAWEAVR